MKGYLLVRAEGIACGLPVEAVQQVFDVDDVHPAPSPHPAFLGVVPFARRMVPFVHLAALLDRRRERPAPSPTAVVIAHGGAFVAVGVDDADALVREVPEPRPPAWDLPWAGGVARRADALVPVVDLAVLVERLETATVGNLQ